MRILVELNIDKEVSGSLQTARPPHFKRRDHLTARTSLFSLSLPVNAQKEKKNHFFGCNSFFLSKDKLGSVVR